MAALSNVLKAGLAIGFVVLLVLWMLHSGKDPDSPTKDPENRLAPPSTPASDSVTE